MLGQKKNNTDVPFVHNAHQFTIIRSVTLAVVAIIISVSLALAWFLYWHVYQTLDAVKQVIEYQAQSGIEAIQFDRLEKVKAEWDRKQNNTSIIPRNLF